MLRQLVPMDLIKSFSPDDWKKVIAGSYNRHTIRTQDDAKVGFLKYVARWPTFGSAFFEVKVRTVYTYISHAGNDKGLISPSLSSGDIGCSYFRGSFLHFLCVYRWDGR